MIKKITALFFMLCSYTAQASNLSGEITNGTLRWSNAANVGSAVMPHGWVNVQPDTVVAWQPGVPSSGANKLTLTLQGASSASAEVSVDVKGIEYVQNGGTEAAPFFAGTATKNGSTYTKSGSGRGAVFYNKTLTYTLAQTPFTLYRPIIELGNLVTALQGKPNGVYQGSIQLSLPFVYKRSNGELVTQRTFSTTIPVQIVNHSVTCDVIAANKAQTINFGFIGKDRLIDGTSNKKVVPMGVSCNNPLTFGGVTLSAREATVAGREVIASNHTGVGIELSPKGAFNRVRLNEEINFKSMFPDNTTNFDLSFYAKPIGLTPSIENKEFEANVTVTLRYY